MRKRQEIQEMLRQVSAKATSLGSLNEMLRDAPSIVLAMKNAERPSLKMFSENWESS